MSEKEFLEDIKEESQEENLMSQNINLENQVYSQDQEEEIMVSKHLLGDLISEIKELRTKVESIERNQ